MIDIDWHSERIAEELSGQHRDLIVKFAWKFPSSGVHAEVIGILREVHHDGAGTTVWVRAVDDADCPGGDKSEFALEGGAAVWLGEAA